MSNTRVPRNDSQRKKRAPATTAKKNWFPSVRPKSFVLVFFCRCGARSFFLAVVAGRVFVLAVVAGARFFFAVVAVPGAFYLLLSLFFAVVAVAVFCLLSLRSPAHLFLLSLRGTFFRCRCMGAVFYCCRCGPRRFFAEAQRQHKKKCWGPQ